MIILLSYYWNCCLCRSWYIYEEVKLKDNRYMRRVCVQHMPPFGVANGLVSDQKLNATTPIIFYILCGLQFK